MTSRSRLIVFAAGLLSWCAYVPGGAQSPVAASSTRPDVKALTPRIPVATENVIIPGPLRSFLRMAGISQKISPEDVLPLLSHNIYIEGYGDGQQTEFLILLDRYVHQARELEQLGGETETIRVANCSDAGPLLHVLGYQLRHGCGQKNDYLVTANPERAFLTIDSGFPLTSLEEALAQGTPFVYQYPSSRVPVIFKESEWTSLSDGKRMDSGNLLNILIHEPNIARLYWGMSKQDAETRRSLQQTIGLKRLLPYAAVLDFYGGELRIRSGRVYVPGEPASENMWKDLVGASPKSPEDFVLKLLAKDNGWLAAYFDVLCRINREQQDHLTQSPRMKRLYEAFRGSDVEVSATRGVFRKAPELLVLFSRVDWDANGKPRIPGDLEAWKQIISSQKSDSKIAKDWAKRTHTWDNSEQLLEAMTGFARVSTDSGPLQIFLTLNEMDSGRPEGKKMSPDTVRLLAKNFQQFNSWYLLFSEFPELNDTSITQFLSTAEGIDKISNPALRGNVQGTYQANIGLWKILARQNEIPMELRNDSWQKVIGPFAKINSPTQMLDAAHSSLKDLMAAAGAGDKATQNQLIELLAGPQQKSADGQRAHQEVADRIRSVMNDQRLVAVDTLIGLNDGLSALANGKPADEKLVALAGELRDFELPRPIFTNNEKIVWAPNVYNTHHAELQARTDLTKVIKGPATKSQIESARGQLAPFLRDTLVGLNYAYYEPPGAQMLHNNPLFVRAHDFSGATIRGAEKLWGISELVGAGSPADGGGYLLGSLADLPYALASAEQDFISPENVQALIWAELVPQLLANATLSRWWNVSPGELHAVTLYQKLGEELVTKSFTNEHLRGEVLGILMDRMGPQRLELAEQQELAQDEQAALLARMGPADVFYLGVEFRKRYPAEAASFSQTNQQLEDIYKQHPEDVSWERLSRDFGVPHPELTRSDARELLNIKPLPFFGGYSSRLFGESWDSGNLYWARLADEMGYSPVMLNLLVPQLTHHMIAKIFATDIEDWPALLRAMQETGDDFRRGRISLPPPANAISQQHTTASNP
jgi:hypothetical protein